MNTTKMPILSILALLNSTLAPTISKVMTHAGTLPWPLSAPGYSRIPYAGRRHAHGSGQLDGAHVVLGPHGRHGHRGHEHHVVQVGGQQQHGPREPMEPRCFSKAQPRSGELRARSRDRLQLRRRCDRCWRSLRARWDVLDVEKQHIVGLHLVDAVSTAATRRRRLPARSVVHRLVRRLGAALAVHDQVPL